MICQIMIQDFMYGWGNDDGYGAKDLEIGIQYCKDLQYEGCTEEPFHHYDLNKFIEWATQKLKLHQEVLS